MGRDGSGGGVPVNGGTLFTLQVASPLKLETLEEGPGAGRIRTQRRERGPRTRGAAGAGRGWGGKSWLTWG